jgi:heptosyltransferase-3
VSAGKILVVRGGAIGDFILTIPVFSALRQQFPDTAIEVLGYPHIAALAKAAGLVNEVRSIDARALAGFFARMGVLNQELQDYFSDFAIVISYLYDPDRFFQTNVGRCSKAQFIAGPHRPDERFPIHATEVFLRPLERLAIFAPDPVPKLLKEKTEAGRRARSRLAIHPGSGSPHKNWPEEKWAETLQRLVADANLDLLLIGGEAEEGRLTRLAGGIPSDRITLAEKLPLVELTEQLRDCDGFAGHDSGITHLAAAVGLPVLALWAETNPDVWRPLGNRVTILKSDRSLRELSVGEVIDRIGTVLE